MVGAYSVAVIGYKQHDACTKQYTCLRRKIERKNKALFLCCFFSICVGCLCVVILFVPWFCFVGLLFGVTCGMCCDMMVSYVRTASGPSYVPVTPPGSLAFSCCTCACAVAQVILPLYPQFSISTSGSSLRVLNEEFTRRPEQWGHKNVVHTVVPSYHDRPGYVNAMANLVAKEVAQFSPEQQKQGVQVMR